MENLYQKIDIFRQQVETAKRENLLRWKPTGIESWLNV